MDHIQTSSRWSRPNQWFNQFILVLGQIRVVCFSHGSHGATYLRIFSAYLEYRASHLGLTSLIFSARVWRLLIISAICWALEVLIDRGVMLLT